MVNNDESLTPQGVPLTPGTSQDKLERERMTRRSALAKFGIRSAVAVLGAFSIDELARIAARKLEQNAGDNKVANKVAQEFKNAGVAFAEDDISASAIAANPCDSGPSHNDCQCNSKQKDHCISDAEVINCGTLSPEQCASLREQYKEQCRQQYLANCAKYHCNCV